MATLSGLVIKIMANNFWVLVDAQIIKAVPRGGLKKNGILVGDNVNLLLQDNIYIIECVNKRKNSLIRPPIANIEQLLIVVACVPKPDYSLVDKLILFAKCYDIEPVIIVNKSDINDDEYKYVYRAYSMEFKVLNVSAKSKHNLQGLIECLNGKISVFTGQSAVGKSALINALFGNESAQEGVLSEKINRGKNTTRHCEIFVKDKLLIADTSGFTSLDEKLLPISYFELPYYYPEYVKNMNKCKYPSCTHTTEKLEDCEIKRLIKQGELDKLRYERYVKIYEILKDKWVRTHG